MLLTMWTRVYSLLQTYCPCNGKIRNSGLGGGGCVWQQLLHRVIMIQGASSLCSLTPCTHMHTGNTWTQNTLLIITIVMHTINQLAKKLITSLFIFSEQICAPVKSFEQEYLTKQPFLGINSKLSFLIFMFILNVAINMTPHLQQIKLLHVLVVYQPFIAPAPTVLHTVR